MRAALATAVFAFAAMLTTAGPAAAADNIMKTCGTQYQAAKANKTLPAGQSWNQFLAACRASQAKPATATTSMTAKTAATPAAAHVAGQPSAAQMAARARMKQCAGQWRADKAANKIPAGQTWPKYWSACSARLKG